MLSLPKILLLAVVGLALWILWRMLQRRGVSDIFSRGPAKPSAGETKALDMDKCRICGDFVPADARACANPRCPYPAA